jgi:membrane-associated phospholipid phosphatase
LRNSQSARPRRLAAISHTKHVRPAKLEEIVRAKRLRPYTPEVIVPEALNPPVQLAKRNRSVTWLAGITIVLVVFLLVLPADIRTGFWHSLQDQAILVSMLLIFSLVAISFVWSDGQQLDTWVFLTFNVRWSHPLWLDRVMLGFTQVGNGFTTLAFAIILFLVSQRYLAYELILGTLTLWLTVMLVKAIAHRARPFIHLTQARIVGYKPRGRSFPSGHTSQSFFIATLIVQHFHVNVWIIILLYTIAMLVGITRMYVGAHYPRDVLAGAILGSAWGLLGVIFDGYVLNGIR